MVRENMFVDAYEWYVAGRGGEDNERANPTYVWLPHPTGLDRFIAILSKFISGEQLDFLEKILRGYYKNLLKNYHKNL